MPAVMAQGRASRSSADAAKRRSSSAPILRVAEGAGMAVAWLVAGPGRRSQPPASTSRDHEQHGLAPAPCAPWGCSSASHGVQCSRLEPAGGQRTSALGTAAVHARAAATERGTPLHASEATQSSSPLVREPGHRGSGRHRHRARGAGRPSQARESGERAAAANAAPPQGERNDPAAFSECRAIHNRREQALTPASFQPENAQG